MDFNFKHYGFKLEKKRLIINPLNLQLKELEFETPRLYVLTNHDHYLYVEYTTEPLIRRIRQGIHLKGPNRYVGYEWGEQEGLHLTVWKFDKLDETQNQAIVGELCLLIKEIHGAWPRCQQKIAFTTDFPFAKVMARNMLREQVLSIEKLWLNDNKINKVFRKTPLQWGFRGDPYLWRELEMMFENEIPASLEEVEKLFHQFFETATGVPFNSEEESVFIKKYHGHGMSGGMIKLSFWREKGLPFLLSSFDEIYYN